MTVRDLTPEQRRELLAAWDAAVDADRAVESLHFPTTNIIRHRDSCLQSWRNAVSDAFGLDRVLMHGPLGVGLGL